MSCWRGHWTEDAGMDQRGHCGEDAVMNGMGHNIIVTYTLCQATQQQQCAPTLSAGNTPEQLPVWNSSTQYQHLINVRQVQESSHSIVSDITKCDQCVSRLTCLLISTAL